MSTELADALQAALNTGHTLAELEATLLVSADTDDRIAGAWLYAWAYDAIRPRRGDLAARVRIVADELRLGDARDPRRRARLQRHRRWRTAPSGNRRGRDGSYASTQLRPSTSALITAPPRRLAWGPHLEPSSPNYA